MIWDDNDDIIKIECHSGSSSVQRHLNAQREARKPYVFITDTMRVEELRRVLVPVTRLQEEVYKAEICAYLCRKTSAEVCILRPNDYGQRAQENINKIVTFLEKFSIPYSFVNGKKDSYSLYKEASLRVSELSCEMLLLTASREYGLDDLFFGPVERYAILHSPVPVMLVNPRADLFSLCD